MFDLNKENYFSKKREISLEELRKVAWYIFKNRENPKLSLRFKLKRFSYHFRWSDKYYVSGNGKINDSDFFIDEIIYHLLKITDLTHLKIGELGELLIYSIREYSGRVGDNIPILVKSDLPRCLNLQVFYCDDFIINFDFAEKLSVLYIVDISKNSSFYKYGYYSENYKNYEDGKKREVFNIHCLKSCIVLFLNDCYINDFSQIPEKVTALSLQNSNVANFYDLTHLKNIEYLDISYTNIESINDLHKLDTLRMLNLFRTKFNENIVQEIIKLKRIEIIITDSINFRDFFDSELIDNNIKVIVLPDHSRNISSEEIIEILNVKDQIKLSNNNSRIETENKLLYSLDYDAIKNILNVV